MKVEVQLSFLELPKDTDDCVPVWAALDDKHKAQVVATLARLMAAKLTAQRNPPTQTTNKEIDHE